MKVHEITPPADTGALLAGAQFADAFRIEVEDRDLDARRAAERMMARQPRWAEALVSLRNLLVAPLGLKTSGAGLVPPERHDRNISGREPNAGSPHRRLQRSPSGFSRRRSRDRARAVGRLCGRLERGDQRARHWRPLRFAGEDASTGSSPDLIVANHHAVSGHWGVPAFVFENEPFFGQDRIDLLSGAGGQGLSAGALTLPLSTSLENALPSVMNPFPGTATEP